MLVLVLTPDPVNPMHAVYALEALEREERAGHVPIVAALAFAQHTDPVDAAQQYVHAVDVVHVYGGYGVDRSMARVVTHARTAGKEVRFLDGHWNEAQTPAA